MSSRLLSGVSIGLWVLSLAGVGVYFLLCEQESSEEPVAEEDAREPIAMDQDQHDALREVMQANLVTLQGLLDACAREDAEAMGALIRAASEAPGVGRAAPGLRPHLPKKWRSWGRTIHREYAQLADGVEAGAKDCGDLPATLAVVTGSCVSCHSTYRVVDAGHPSAASSPSRGSGNR